MPRKDAQKEHYDAIAKRMRVKQLEVGARAFPSDIRAPYTFVERWFLEHDVKGKRILDYGCGLRVHSIVLAKVGACVYGVDISAATVGIADSTVFCGHLR
jgi:2-polyprenyl-3-methyl-5-hydroxy-6-metoxy-1,4-benzoquinol methylase